ncbi:amidase [Lactococcus hodotermopsidis]|uniref:Amidase n=1 Tax=Pseudolactococcus hodotermopsidis TaxID=2709157 RepID=A0A6A0BEH4_9LACT|nr:CHAP domain-containing protein [Lactococcus hodotermopsidis]GFH43103.1 amidase [Lactococcus hodotermopsidis]
MKKKLISAILLSTVILTSASAVIAVNADDTDDKIAAQNDKIASTKSKEAEAQAEVTRLQTQVDDLKAKQDKLKKETEDLKSQSDKLKDQIADLRTEIAERDERLKAQARSAQTDGAATSYVEAVINSKSLSDAVSRITAMRTVIKANNDMMKQQDASKNDLEKALETRQSKVNEGYEKLNQIEDQAKTFETQQAELKVATLNLAAERATAEDEKSSLLAEKAAAEKAAAEKAAAEKAYNEQQAAAIAKAKEQAKEGVVIPPTPGGGDVIVIPDPIANPPKPVPTDPSNRYPVGQCTWGAKSLAPWAGNNWGNGGEWAASAAAAGFRLGSVPQVGAIAVWQGGYGHVAVVYDVNSSTGQIRVQESNYAGNQYIDDFRGWFTPSGVTYIYPN